MKCKFKRFRDATGVPKKATPGSCYDVYSARDVRLAPGVTKKVDLDFGFQFTKKHMCTIYPRSDLSLRPIFLGGWVVVSDYPGKISVILTNFDSSDVEIQIGDRIAQIMFLRTAEALFEEVVELNDITVRGFGSADFFS